MKIVLIDEINCVLEGFDYDVIQTLQKEIKYMKKGAFMEAGYKLGITDGYVPMVDDEGVSYIYFLERIAEVLETKTNVDVDSIVIVDNRKDPIPLPEDISDVPVDYLAEETGYPEFRTQQHAGIITALTERRGVLELATNTGKTIICLGISKRLDPYMKTIIIAPSNQLVTQTGEDYAKSDLNYGLLTSKLSPKKRKQLIEDTRHIITTSKMFINCIEMFDSSEYALIVDEIHIFGEVFADALRLDFNNTQMSIGLTGTLPHDDKLKLNTIFATMGGGRLQHVTTKEITDYGYASTVEVKHVVIHDPEIEQHFEYLEEEDLFDWETERSYLVRNVERMQTIRDYLNSLPKENTLVLCHAELGSLLASDMGTTFIRDETPSDERKRLFGLFNELDDHMQLASFGTSATGISENRIFRLVLIDLGMDRKLLLQSIGRAIRLDGERDHVTVIDVASRTKYSQRHQKKRLGYCRKEGHTVKKSPNILKVER